MQEETVAMAAYPEARPPADLSDSNTSGVSWAAIFAGAAAAAALSLILVILGFGLGLSAVSPWAYAGAGALTIGIATAVWLAAMQIIASGLGGYIAGRLRVKWPGLHTDEVYFRDTAHGMLSWAIATLVTAAFMGSALTGIVSGGAELAGNVAGGIAGATGQAAAATAQRPDAKDSSGGVLSYFVDQLFRADRPPADQNTSQQTGEAATIFANDLRTGALSDSDKSHLGRLVAQRAGLSQADAEKRVVSVYSQADRELKKLEATAKTAADKARKAAAATALWMFVALLCGAFSASFFAIYGGRRRDAAVIELRAIP